MTTVCLALYFNGTTWLCKSDLPCCPRVERRRKRSAGRWSTACFRLRSGRFPGRGSGPSLGRCQRWRCQVCTPDWCLEYSGRVQASDSHHTANRTLDYDEGDVYYCYLLVTCSTWHSESPTWMEAFSWLKPVPVTTSRVPRPLDPEKWRCLSILYTTSQKFWKHLINLTTLFWFLWLLTLQFIISCIKTTHEH